MKLLVPGLADVTSNRRKTLMLFGEYPVACRVSNAQASRGQHPARLGSSAPPVDNAAKPKYRCPPIIASLGSMGTRNLLQPTPYWDRLPGSGDNGHYHRYPGAG